MLKNIKSLYILKIIFSLETEETKLKIIRYNKTLQKNIDISLLNYQIFSGRYLVYEAGGKGKEYDCYNEQLMFEGEYLNGKRNGKGKEYNEEGKLIFEGEYLNGKRWNGKGFDYNNNIVYELKNGRGYVKEFNYTLLSFEGEYKNGIRWKGKRKHIKKK